MWYGMKKGDLAFFYHSNCKNPGIVGVVEVIHLQSILMLTKLEIIKEAYPDCTLPTLPTLLIQIDTAWDENHPYFDHKSQKEDPRWFMVDVQFTRHLNRIITLTNLKQYKFTQLSNLEMLKRSQLSVSKVSKEDWEFIIGLEEESID
ncbi:Thymocyte nuclear protein 1 [Neolecta irregularis DAH-3]|uniref:Thymocyte nuclear protein 1 n=1 Tax=Neolecta irregularis (strain DAH-3) TaxID=1198029 RepID=A0A1U7LQW3_NEOID|nr:Thymocyte nuclear protein 1 [Neolecta irregularis DAH-3]|eukprot:OLL25018.1 Thymocyte nuclear protein 1 [Neolecta irregularis DAH-3]